MRSMEEQILNRILDKVVSLEENMVRRDDFEERTQRLHNEMINYVDGFVKLHTHLNTEHLALCTRVDRLQHRLERMEKKVWPGL